jgi:hypothetical protein
VLLLAQRHPEIGFDADAPNTELQTKIETAVCSTYPKWQFEALPFSGSSVVLRGSLDTERLSVTTHYMVTTEDARRRLESMDRSMSVGIGEPFDGIGEQAFFMVYGSQVILRFRQHEVVVEVWASTSNRDRPWNDGLWPKRQELVLDVGPLIVEQIRGY